jgi:hypothetical protein
MKHSFKQRLTLAVHSFKRKEQWYGQETTDNAIIKRKAQAFLAANPPQGRAVYLLG